MREINVHWRLCSGSNTQSESSHPGGNVHMQVVVDFLFVLCLFECLVQRASCGHCEGSRCSRSAGPAMNQIKITESRISTDSSLNSKERHICMGALWEHNRRGQLQKVALVEVFFLRSHILPIAMSLLMKYLINQENRRYPGKRMFNACWIMLKTKKPTHLELENRCTREQNHPLFFLTWGFVVFFFFFGDITRGRLLQSCAFTLYARGSEQEAWCLKNKNIFCPFSYLWLLYARYSSSSGNVWIIYEMQQAAHVLFLQTSLKQTFITTNNNK